MSTRNAAAHDFDVWQPDGSRRPAAALAPKTEPPHRSVPPKRTPLLVPQTLMGAMARIVAIDDDPANLGLISELLRAAGHDAPWVFFENTLDLPHLRQQMPDLVLCAVSLPGGLTAQDIAQRLGVERRSGALRLIAITSQTENADAAALAAGYDGHISKPIDPDTFVDDVEAFLPAYLRLGNAPFSRRGEFRPTLAVSHVAQGFS